ncbi:MAG TPA: Lrp/AsnC family transcriptional regulator [Candidatus Hydrogenedentes bacterium]|nr:Lrp/AsnC family transcriptional regulator [Candidatus Hydrogenedentota bacterium]HOL77162.1 Lrp/AsnC family transcriptional regulator [Candidatus Hydrogenedentota bacterium]HPO85899.1 Lrp/AsnC family transcriptional regulator [Candidatus Hydrogenedentota bacterium]
MNLADWEIALLQALEKPLPLVSKPFEEVARQIGIPEDVVLERIRSWLAQGTLRRFGARVAHNRIGYTANGMSVWNVPDEQRDQVGQVIAAFPEVSHCYARPRATDWPYNVFAMIHGARKEDVLDVAQKIAQKIKVTDYQVLFTVRELKKTTPQIFSNSSYAGGFSL